MAKKKVRDLKEKAEAGKKELERVEKMEERERKMATLESEHDFFIAKLERKMNSLNWGLINDYNEIITGVKLFEDSLDDWYLLNGKLKGLFESYVEKFEKNFHEIVDRVGGKIADGKLRMKEILSQHEENARRTEEERVRVEEEKINEEQKRFKFEQELMDAERKMYAKNLYDEVKLLSTSLIKNCQIDIESIGDYQLLELKKNVFHFTTELREILNKITSFSKLVVHCGEQESRMMVEL